MSRPVTLTTLDVAKRYLGVEEDTGPGSNPMVLGWLRQVQSWPSSDAVPWCAAFVHHVAWVLGLPTPPKARALSARSWLSVGEDVPLHEARPGDVVVLRRGAPPAGHVGFFAGLGAMPGTIRLIGGNQGDSVSTASYPANAVLGVRRL
jgi:uncharacterized protein (TIGR02594 family)